MKNKSTLPKELQKETERFFESAQPVRLSRNLRTLLLNYFAVQQDGHGFKVEDLFYDLIWLFEWLDVAADELPAGGK